MSRRSVRDAAFEVLREQGLTTLFANPGSTELHLLADLPEDLRFVLGLHEASVVGMATGWAIGRGEPALAILHTTAGLGNAVGALATARVNRAPLVVLVGQQDRRHLAFEPFLAGRLHGLAGEYPVWADQPVRPQDVPGSIARACHEAVTASGPALVIVPMDDWAAEAGEPRELSAAGRVVRARAADARAVAELAELIAGAAAPVLVVGAGADDPEAWAALVALAERLRCPVWQESFGARAGFPQDHPSSRAICPPIAPACGRRSRRTTSCWRWAPPCSVSTRTSKARWSSPGPASRSSATTRRRCTAAPPIRRCLRRLRPSAPSSPGSSRNARGRRPPGSRRPARPGRRARASRSAPATSSPRSPSGCPGMRS